MCFGLIVDLKPLGHSISPKKILTSNKISRSSLFISVTAMTPTKRHGHPHQLKNDIIQKVDSGSKLQKEYNITPGNLSKWISSVNEINDKIHKRQCEVMNEVETDKEQIDKCEILTTDLTSPILKSVFKCRCNYRFIRECHIFRHLRYKNSDDENISQKNVNSHIKNHKIETSEHACQKMDEIDNNNKFTFYTCKFCEQTFTHLSAIRRHTRLHTAERKFICSLCGDRFIKICN